MREKIYPVQPFSPPALREIGVKLVKELFSEDLELQDLVGKKLGCWRDLAIHLKRYSTRTQKKFLKIALGPEGADFHNSKKLGLFFADVINMGILSPEEKPDQNLLRKQVASHLRRLNLKSIPIRIMEADLSAAQGETPDTSWIRTYEEAASEIQVTAINSLRDRSQNVAYEAVQDTILELAKNVPEDILKDALKDLAFCAGWIIVRDLMSKKGYSKGNPFEPLANIWKAGAWPVGVVNNEFVIFVP